MEVLAVRNHPAAILLSESESLGLGRARGHSRQFEPGLGALRHLATPIYSRILRFRMATRTGNRAAVANRSTALP